MREVRLALLVVALTAVGCTRPNPALRPGSWPFVDGSPAADRWSDMGEVMPVPEPAADGGAPESPERADTDVDVDVNADVGAQVEVEVEVAVDEVLDSPGVEGALSTDGSPPDVASDLPPPDSPPSVNIAAGLRAQWVFNEGTGTEARDPVGGNLGTLQGGASFVPSAIPKVDYAVGRHAVHFDGDNAHMTIAIQSLPSLEAPKTIAFWMSPQVVSHPALRTIMALTGSAGGGVRLGTDGGRPAMWQPGQSQGDIVAPPLPALAWHHLVYTWDGQRHRLYLDGTFAGESSRAPALAGATAVAVLARAAPDGSDEIYAGDVDDLRIYDRVINQAEMDRLRRGE